MEKIKGIKNQERFNNGYTTWYTVSEKYNQSFYNYCLLIGFPIAKYSEIKNGHYTCNPIILNDKNFPNDNVLIGQIWILVAHKEAVELFKTFIKQFED